jgi:predicted phage terminase large subunit-like protein
MQQQESLQLPQTPPPIDPALLTLGLADPVVRRELVKQFKYFCLIYLPHYFELAPADFFDDLIANLQDDSIDALLVIGFRGSAKSTFVSTAYILYAATVKKHLYPFIVSLVSTGDLASATIAGVKRELEENELLKEDFGVPQFATIRGLSWEVRNKLESKDEWQARNLLLSTGVRILARSRGQRIRGIRHGVHRIKLAIGDDMDDLKSIATQENRNSTAQWWRGEVVGALALEARRILVGNWLHLDGLMARMKASGRYKVLEFPLLREGDGSEWERCTWKAAFPTQKKIDDKRVEMGDIGFRREMLLQVVPEEGQDVLPEDIHYYDDPPFDDGNYLVHGVDLAISTQQSADYTAVVSGEITWPNGKLEIYVQPNPIIRHMTFNDTMAALDNVRHSSTMSSEFFVEAVQYQQVAIEEMERRAFAVTGVRPIKDKRARLRVAARYIKNGTVKFPRKGCEQLMTQLLGFGAEKHDDAVDALVYLILGVAGDSIEQKVIQYV